MGHRSVQVGWVATQLLPELGRDPAYFDWLSIIDITPISDSTSGKSGIFPIVSYNRVAMIASIGRSFSPDLSVSPADFAS
jgi:hypothetical protein